MRLGAEKPEAFFISVFKAEGGGNCSFTKVSSWLLTKWVCSLISGARRQLLHFFFVLLSFLWILTKKPFIFIFYFLSGIRASGDVRASPWAWWSLTGRRRRFDGRLRAENPCRKWNPEILDAAGLDFCADLLMRDERAGNETPDKSCSLMQTF